MPKPQVITATITLASLLTTSALLFAAAEMPETPKVPAAVQKTIKTLAGDNKTTEVSFSIEDGKTVYDVEFVLNGGNYAADIDADGTILTREVEIDPAVVPPAVTDSAKKAHADGTIAEYAIVTNGDAMYYGVDVKVGKDTRELDISPTGKIIKDSVEAPETPIPSAKPAPATPAK